MATTVDRYRIELDTASAVRNLGNLQNEVEDTTNSFDQLQTLLGQLAIGAFIVDTINSARALDDFSRSSGIAVERLKALTDAIAQNGANQDNAIDSIGQFTSKLREAAGGSKDAQDAFAAVGITLQDLRDLTNEQLLVKTFEGLSEIRENVTRLGIQMNLFGEEFRVVNTRADGVITSLRNLQNTTVGTASSIQAAAEAARRFENAIQIIRDELLVVIEPFATLIARMLESESVIRPLIATILNAVIAISALAIVGKIASMFTAFISGVGLLSLSAKRTAESFTSIRKSIDGFKTSAYLAGAVFESLRFGAGNLAGWMTKLKTIFVALASVGLRIIPVIGQITALFYILNTAIREFTGLSLVDWFNESAVGLRDFVDRNFPRLASAVDDLGERLGMAPIDQFRQEVDQMSASTAGLVNAVDEVNLGIQEQAGNLREVQDAMEGEQRQLSALLEQYRRNNAVLNERYQLETALIGIGQESSDKARQLAEIDFQYQERKLALLDQLREKQDSSSAADQSFVPQIQTALAELEDAYRSQRTELEALIDARTAANRAEQISLFQTESLVDANRRLAEMQHEIAAVTMPELARRYALVESQAQLAAEAAIAAEEARRGSMLSEAERNQYLEAATARVRELQAAEFELARAQEARRLSDFGSESRIEVARRIRDIQHEMATSILPQRARIEADLRFEAQERARAEIAAENARRGRGAELSAAEEQAYYEAAEAGVRDLIAVTQEHYDTQRTWVNGWRRAFEQYVDEATNAATQAERVFARTTQGMEDLIVEFAKTGKFEFRSFINSVLEDLLRSQIRQLISSTFGTFSNSGSQSGGGIVSSLGSLLGFANGGIIPTNQPVLVGERGPEIISGAGGRTVVSNEELRSGGTTNVTYNINAVDASSFRSLVASDPAFIHAVVMQGAKSVPGRR